MCLFGGVALSVKCCFVFSLSSVPCLLPPGRDCPTVRDLCFTGSNLNLYSIIFKPLQALQQVDKFRNEQQETLSERTATPTSQLKFVVDAWMQVRKLLLDVDSLNACSRLIKEKHRSLFFSCPFPRSVTRL